ncbi:MAG: hypothetical protein KBI01_03475 [Oscillospiraceae bacterium]|nr:hypothetical protein [Oscillospiraceae bacterium]
MEIEIAGCYPIILNGETAGEITVSREGLFWSFEANCEMRDEIVRLSVYGDGKEGYLGIMEPFGDMLKLTKKFSRAALKDFPERISHAGQKGGSEEIEIVLYSPPSPVVAEIYEGEFPLSCYDAKSEAPVAPPEDDKPPPLVFNSPPVGLHELDWHPCPMPCSLFSGLKEKRLCSSITGAYIAQGSDFQLLAIPEDVAENLPEESSIQFVDKIIIYDSVYLICKIKHGKSVSEL